jgi:hypothetical protein
MERQKVAEAVLYPVDQLLEAALNLVRSRGVFDQTSDAAYRLFSASLRRQFELLNELEVLGTENVPTECISSPRKSSETGRCCDT